MAVVWLSGYLAATGVIFVTSGQWRLAALHAALIAIGMWTLRSRDETGLTRLIGDLLPLVVAPLLYGEIPALIAAAGTTYHDALVQGWEATLFGGQPARTLAGRLPSAAVSEVLHAGYLAYYPVIFIPPLVLLWRGERLGYAQTILALTVAYTVCWTIYVLFPVQGPRYLWGTPAGMPAGPMRRMAVSILAAGSSRGAAFPSSHMAVSLVQAMLAWRWQRRVAPVLLVVALLVGAGAVYGGFHYAIDMVAGAMLGAAVGVVVLARSRCRRTRPPLSLPVPHRVSMSPKRRATPLFRQIDRYVGIPAAALLAAAPKRKRPPDSSIRRIGILKTAAVGDTLLLVGIPEALETRFPGARIVMITGRDNAGVVPLLGKSVREHVIVAPTRPIAAARAIRRLRLDLLLECGPWPRIDALLGALSGARYRVGFRVKGQARHFGFDSVVDHSSAVHQLENFRQLARAVGATELAVPAIARPGVLQRGQMPAGPYAVFHPWSGGFMGGVKEWPAERWLELGRRLFRERGLRIVVTGGPGDVERGAELAGKLTAAVAAASAESVAGSYSLVEMADLLAESALVVSVNTGIMHLAALVGARTVSLDGPTPVRRWGPLGPRVRSAVARGSGCGYLDLGFEYAGQRLDCMNEISVEDVMRLVNDLTG